MNKDEWKNEWKNENVFIFIVFVVALYNVEARKEGNYKINNVGIQIKFQHGEEENSLKFRIYYKIRK